MNPSTSAPYYHVEFLKRHFSSKTQNNPRYSLRAFARDLNIHVSALSRILSGRQDPSPKICRKMLSRLDLPEEERLLFLGSLIKLRAQRLVDKFAPLLWGLHADHPEGANALAAEELKKDLDLEISVKSKQEQMH